MPRHRRAVASVRPIGVRGHPPDGGARRTAAGIARMTTLQMLTLRRNAALARLATLQRRAERLTSPASGVVTSALGELTAALEEMQVATEQLHITVEELAAARVQLQQVQQNFMAFMDILPT